VLAKAFCTLNGHLLMTTTLSERGGFTPAENNALSFVFRHAAPDAEAFAAADRGGTTLPKHGTIRADLFGFL
jgi:hypothetical protein